MKILTCPRLNPTHSLYNTKLFPIVSSMGLINLPYIIRKNHTDTETKKYKKQCSKE